MWHRTGHDNATSTKDQVLGENPEWFLDKVEVADPRGPTTTTFECGNWLSKNKGDGHIERDLAAKRAQKVTHRYRVKLKTGPDSNMGTAARVYIRLHNADGSEVSSKIELLDSNQLVKFEAGQTDLFTVTTSFQGFEHDAPRHVTVGHDGGRAGDDWFLEKIYIYKAPLGKASGSSKPTAWWERSVKKWIGPTTATNQVQVKLKPKEAEEKQENSSTWKNAWKTKGEFSRTAHAAPGGAAARGKGSTKGTTFVPETKSVVAAEKKKRRAKEAEEALVLQKRTAENERRAEAKKAHDNWVKRQKDKAKEDHKAAVAKQKKETDKKEALLKTRRVLRENRGLAHEAWLEAKADRDRQAKQEKERTMLKKQSMQRVRVRSLSFPTVRCCRMA